MTNKIFKKTYDKIKSRFSPGLLKAFIILILFGFCTLVFLKPATAENSKTNNSNTVSSQRSTPQLSASAVNPVTQAAVNAGILSCTSRINQVMAYLTANTQSGAYLFIPNNQPDQSVFSVSIEAQGQNAPPMYASASFAPTTNGRVGAVYDSVQYLPQSCAEVEKNFFNGLKRSGIIKKDIVILDAGAVKIFLMPAGHGCIVIKKEVVQ